MKANKSPRLIQDVFSPLENDLHKPPRKLKWHKFFSITPKHFVRQNKVHRSTTAVFSNSDQLHELEELAHRLKKHS